MNASNVIEVLEFADDYLKQKQNLQSKLPYNINIIEELPANEVAHSRILAKLLQYKHNGRYVVLQSFLDYIGDHFPDTQFNSIKINKPDITQETEHIDIWVRDETYAIIIENKINNAKDQDTQLATYINKTIYRGYNPNQIFVIYMPSTPVEPDQQTWGIYECDFKERYCNLSFSDHILLWLEETLLPLLYFDNEPVLKSCLIQYIDYLQGRFFKRKSFNSYYMDINSIIKEKLHLTGQSTKAQYDTIVNKISEFTDVITKMNDIRDALRAQYWHEEFSKDEPNYAKAPNCLFGCNLLYMGERYMLIIDIEGSKKSYCQLDKEQRGDGFLIADDPLMSNTELHKVLVQQNKIQVWKYYDINDIDGVFNCFLNALNILKSLGCKVEHNE